MEQRCDDVEQMFWASGTNVDVCRAHTRIMCNKCSDPMVEQI